jgi:predicted metal-dependent HD superfamily phosphohydrolase
MRTSFGHWQNLWQRLGLVGDGLAWYERLSAAYSEPQRAYHSLQHLEECLQVFDQAKKSGLMCAPDFIEMALWFHDGVYDPRSSENERLSARMAIEAFGDDTQAAREVERLIMLTKSHQPVDHPDDAWIIDIDLAIFAQEPKRGMEYERQIRAEYAWVPKDVYREKRVEILRGFLNRAQIYQTAWAQSRFEADARLNLQLLIRRF